MKALLLGLLLVVMPAAAQWTIPDKLPPLPDGGSTCNETHCLVNRSDWVTLELLAQIAGVRLAQKDEEISRLARENEFLKSLKFPQCAKVERLDRSDRNTSLRD